MMVSGLATAPSRRVGLRGCGLLQAVQEIRRALRVRCRAEYRPLVVLQHLDPRRDIGGVVFANLRREFEVGTKESGTELGDKLLDGVAFIAEPLAAEVAVKARRVARPVRSLMRERGVIALGVAEALERRHLHVVVRDAVVSHRPALSDGGACRGKEPFRTLDALHGLGAWRGLRVIVFGQAVYLLDVKDGVALHERDSALALLARVRVGFGADNLVGVHDKAAVLALADRC